VYPELLRFTILGRERALYSYPLLVALGILVAILIAIRLGRRDGLARWDTASVGLVGFGAGLLGAVLLDLIANPGGYRGFLSEPSPPGMAFLGGLIVGGVAGLAIVRRFRLPLGAVGDAAAPAIPIGHAIGRLGCLLAGCCHGSPSGSWPGLVFRDPDAPAFAISRGALPLHPVQLYEAIGLVLLGAGLLLARRKARWRGRLLPAYLGGYAILRLLTETLRGDQGRGGVGPLSTSQLIAIALLLILGVSHVRRARGPTPG
jgi:phosphatidylglycerol:prolipoprotein diacylglycerol transferase